MSATKKISNHSFALHLDDGRVFTLSNHRGDDMTSVLWSTCHAQNWESLPQSAGEYRIVPYGPNNMLPSELRSTVDDNNLAPGIIERQLGLLYGQGVHLYQLSFDGGNICRIWQQDADIQQWLDSWDYISYIKGITTDYLYLKGFFNAVYLERGARIGRKPRIALLEHIPAKNARLEWTDSRKLTDVKHIIVGNFEQSCVDTGVMAYPVYDRRNPGRYPASASYNSTYSFSRDFYSVPPYWGALRWIVRGSEIPTIFKYVTDNGLNLAYHIHSPKEYWDNKREILKLANPEWSEAEIENEIGSLSVRLLDTLTEVLSGKENAGKFFHTVDIADDSGTTHSWKIEAIDQKIKDFVESQIKISEASSSAITSGMGLHPSLSNVMVNGKLASGSEMLYAFRLHLLSNVAIAEQAILEPINQAIAFNFPEKNLRLGFYHQSLKAEEALSSGDRIKNQQQQ